MKHSPVPNKQNAVQHDFQSIQEAIENTQQSRRNIPITRIQPPLGTKNRTYLPSDRRVPCRAIHQGLVNCVQMFSIETHELCHQHPWIGLATAYQAIDRVQRDARDVASGGGGCACVALDRRDVEVRVCSVAPEAAVLVDIRVAGLGVAQREEEGVAPFASMSRGGDDGRAVDLVAGAAGLRTVALQFKGAKLY